MSMLPAKPTLTPEVINQIFEVVEMSPGRFHLRVKSSVTISFDDLEIFTTKGTMSLDTIDGILHLNGRMGRTLKDLPESIEYREKMRRKALEQTCQRDCPMKDQFERIISALKSAGISV